MIDTIYVEEAVDSHPRVREILARFDAARTVSCRHYGELFNRRNQNFRLQKAGPALILAAKLNRRVLPIPAGYGINGDRGYYFSHLLNCLYDCRYCFLQGKFRSAHYVLFVNYEDFIDDIEATCEAANGDVWFFSGYDCDSLAFEPVTDFAAQFIPRLAKIENAWLELRTKSTQIRTLLNMRAQRRCVCAFSLSPHAVIAAFEHKTPGLDARLDAMQRLIDRGWPVGIRFDPMIMVEDFRSVYGGFFDLVFSRLDASRLHSITIGTFRMPPAFAKVITRLYPEEPLYSAKMNEHNGTLSYPPTTVDDMLKWSAERIGAHVPAERIFNQTA
jgi:spore photoproduct lyase